MCPSVSRKRQLVDPENTKFFGEFRNLRTFSRPFRGRNFAGREISWRAYRPYFSRAD